MTGRPTGREHGLTGRLRRRGAEATEQWCSENGRRPAGVNWEVYGDWDDDPAKRRTDIYFLLEPAS